MDALDVCDAFGNCKWPRVSQGARIVIFRHTLATLASTSRMRRYYDCRDSSLHRIGAPAGEGQDVPRKDQRSSPTLASGSMESHPRSRQGRSSRRSEKGSRHCRQVLERAASPTMRGCKGYQMSSLCKTHIIHFDKSASASYVQSDVLKSCRCEAHLMFAVQISPFVDVFDAGSASARRR